VPIWKGSALDIIGVIRSDFEEWTAGLEFKADLKAEFDCERPALTLYSFILRAMRMCFGYLFIWFSFLIPVIVSFLCELLRETFD